MKAPDHERKLHLDGTEKPGIVVSDEELPSAATLSGLQFNISGIIGPALGGTNFFRSTLSARAPAGSVNRKKGSDATVDMREMKNGDPVETFIIQVAALSWAATQVPETTVAIQSFLNTGFLSAIQVELSFMIGGLHPVTKAARSPSFRKFCS